MTKRERLIRAYQDSSARNYAEARAQLGYLLEQPVKYRNLPYINQRAINGRLLQDAAAIYALTARVLAGLTDEGDET